MAVAVLDLLITHTKSKRNVQTLS